MSKDNITLILATLAFFLSVYAAVTARDATELAKSTFDSISRVQQSQASLQETSLRNQDALTRTTNVNAQALEELYTNQELMAQLIGIEVEEPEEETAIEEQVINPGEAN